MPPRYTTTQAVADDRNIVLSGKNAQDLTQWIEAAETEIDRHCHRRFSPGPTEARAFPVRRARDVLWLPDMGAVPTLVEMRDGLDCPWHTVTDWEAQEPQEEDWPYEALVRPRGWQPPSRSQRRIATVRVTVRWDWPGQCPEDVSGASRILSHRLSRRYADPIMAAGGLLGDPDVKRILIPYVKVRLR